MGGGGDGGGWMAVVVAVVVKTIDQVELVKRINQVVSVRMIGQVESVKMTDQVECHARYCWPIFRLTFEISKKWGPFGQPCSLSKCIKCVLYNGPCTLAMDKSYSMSNFMAFGAQASVTGVQS